MPRVACIIDTTYDHARAILAGIQTAAAARGGCDVLAFREDPPTPALLRRWGAEGIIGAFGRSQPAGRYARLGLPILNVSSRPQRPPVANLLLDQRAIGRLAAEHLLAQGATAHALVLRPGTNFSHLRAEGYTAALKAQGRDARKRPPQREKGTRRARAAGAARGAGDGRGASKEGGIHARIELPHALPAAFEALGPWLEALPRGCAVFAVGDLEARLVLAAAQARSIAVPETLLVMGANDERQTCLGCRPTLSSVDARGEALGRAAFAWLLARIRGEADPIERERIVPPGEVVARGSTDRAAAATDPLVREAVALIRAQLASGIDVSRLARRLGVGVKTLENHFRAALGRAPLAELHATRLARAKRLLAESDLRIREVATRVGCQREGHFCSFFKDRVGQTPSQYRATARADGAYGADGTNATAP